MQSKDFPFQIRSLTPPPRDRNRISKSPGVLRGQMDRLQQIRLARTVRSDQDIQIFEFQGSFSGEKERIFRRVIEWNSRDIGRRWLPILALGGPLVTAIGKIVGSF